MKINHEYEERVRKHKKFVQKNTNWWFFDNFIAQVVVILKFKSFD